MAIKYDESAKVGDWLPCSRKYPPGHPVLTPEYIANPPSDDEIHWAQLREIPEEQERNTSSGAQQNPLSSTSASERSGSYWPWNEQCSQQTSASVPAIPPEETAWYEDRGMVSGSPAGSEVWYDVVGKKFWRRPRCTFDVLAKYEPRFAFDMEEASINWEGPSRGAGQAVQEVLESPKGKQRRVFGVVKEERRGEKVVLRKSEREGVKEKWEGRISVVLDGSGLSVVGWRLIEAVDAAGERVEIEKREAEPEVKEKKKASPKRKREAEVGQPSKKQKKRAPKTPGPESKKVLSKRKQDTAGQEQAPKKTRSARRRPSKVS